MRTCSKGKSVALSAINVGQHFQKLDVRSGLMKTERDAIEVSALQRKFRAIARALKINDDLKLYCACHTFETVVMAEENRNL